MTNELHFIRTKKFQNSFNSSIELLRDNKTQEVSVLMAIKIKTNATAKHDIKMSDIGK